MRGFFEMLFWPWFFAKSMIPPKVVAVSGGFDPLHVGHLRYIQAAKSLGVKVVVILNTDDFLIKKKGYAFMKFNERKEILEGLSCVDLVVPCIDEDQTVCKTLAALKPDIFAKGGDRTAGNIPEYDTCAEHDIEMIFGVGGTDKPQSSSWLVNRFREHEKG
jgi:cytidyltransferase-like protein